LETSYFSEAEREKIRIMSDNPFDNYSWTPKEHEDSNQPVLPSVGTNQTSSPDIWPEGTGGDSTGDTPSQPGYRSIHFVDDAVFWGDETKRVR